MKFSLDWLRQYIDLPEEEARIAAALAEAGLPVEAIEPWGADHRFDIDVLANRPDCMCHFGLARELAARLERPVRPPADEPPRGDRLAADLAAVEIAAPDLCSRYTALVLEGVKVAPSPDWLEDRLASIGLRPINNIVDATNFVLWELGHPLHAFDLDRLEERRIIVRRAAAGETLTTLDGVRRRLATEQLVIADGRRAVALAGVMGGADTEIRAGTTRVLLESAHFAPAGTRRTARAHALHTDASHRFERGADPGVTLAAALRAAALILRVAGGTLAEGAIDVLPRPLARRTLTLSMRRLARLLGMPVEAKRAAGCLSRLGFEVSIPSHGENGATLSVGVPTWRGDVEREVDLIEEVARLIGYEAVPVTLPGFLTARTGQPRPLAGQDRARRFLAAAGYRETLNCPMSDPELQRPFAETLGPGRAFVLLDNPMTPQMRALRASLVPGLLANVAWNHNRGQESMRLFEVGRVFAEPAAGETEEQRVPGRLRGVRLPVERARLAAIACGARRSPHWSGKQEPVGYYDLKGVLEGLCRRVLGLEADIRATGADELAFLSAQCRGEILLLGRGAGFIGRLDGALANACDLVPEVFLFEVDLGSLPPAPRLLSYRPLPRYPPAERDLALVVDAAVPYARLVEVIRGTGGDLLEAVWPFDRYTGGAVPPGRVSVAVRLSFRHAERTLTAAEVAEAQARIVERLRADLGVVLREA